MYKSASCYLGKVKLSTPPQEMWEDKPGIQQKWDKDHWQLFLGKTNFWGRAIFPTPRSAMHLPSIFPPSQCCKHPSLGAPFCHSKQALFDGKWEAEETRRSRGGSAGRRWRWAEQEDPAPRAVTAGEPQRSPVPDLLAVGTPRCQGGCNRRWGWLKRSH